MRKVLIGGMWNHSDFTKMILPKEIEGQVEVYHCVEMCEKAKKHYGSFNRGVSWLIEEMNIAPNEKVVLIAHSFGAQYAMKINKTIPEQVAGIVLLSPCDGKLFVIKSLFLKYLPNALINGFKSYQDWRGTHLEKSVLSVAFPSKKSLFYQLFVALKLTFLGLDSKDVPSPVLHVHAQQDTLIFQHRNHAELIEAPLGHTMILNSLDVWRDVLGWIEGLERA